MRDENTGFFRVEIGMQRNIENQEIGIQGEQWLEEQVPN